MVSWLPTALIPGLLALAFLPIERKRVFWLLPVVWLPDIDYIVPSEHRAITHSIFWPTATLVALIIYWRRSDPTAAWHEFATRPGHASHLTLATFFLTAHLMLDTFAGGVVLFWPLIDINFAITWQIWLDTATNSFETVSYADASPGAPALSPQYPWLSGEHTAFAAVILLFAPLFWLLRPRKTTVWRHARVADNSTPIPGGSVPDSNHNTDSRTKV